jgi:hypothetical protein
MPGLYEIDDRILGDAAEFVGVELDQNEATVVDGNN